MQLKLTVGLLVCLWGWVFFSATENSNLQPYCPKDQACKLHDFLQDLQQNKIKQVLQSVCVKMPQMFYHGK